jgi:protein subunit release factor A
MILRRRNPAAVTLHHIPSEISAYCESHRRQYENRNLAIQCLKARLYASTHIEQNNHVVASYELPDDVTYPNQLDEYKRDV